MDSLKLPLVKKKPTIKNNQTKPNDSLDINKQLNIKIKIPFDHKLLKVENNMLR